MEPISPEKKKKQYKLEKIKNELENQTEISAELLESGFKENLYHKICDETFDKILAEEMSEVLIEICQDLSNKRPLEEMSESENKKKKIDIPSKLPESKKPSKITNSNEFEDCKYFFLMILVLI